MRTPSITKTKIKCSPKMDGSLIALIIHYIEQTQKSSPGMAVPWSQLVKRFNYSRQALQGHEPIKMAYLSAKAAASAHQNAPGVNGDGAPEPGSVALQKKRLAKLQEENRNIKQQNADLLEFVAQLIREAQQKGISLAGMTAILPQEHHHAVFQMTPVAGPQAKAEH